jgi:hypothetical protein
VRPVNTILDRFRRVAPVPAAAGDDLARELAPLFAALDAIEGEANELRAQAVVAAERRVEDARAEAAHLAAVGRAEAEEARRDAEIDARRASGKQSKALGRAAEAEARRIREAGAQRIPALVQEVVTCVKGGAR